MIVDLYQDHFKQINIKNKVYNYYSNLIKANKQLETKNILIDETKYKKLTIYFARYHCKKSREMLVLSYHELMAKIEEYE